MTIPTLARRLRKPSFDVVDHPWRELFGSDHATCDHCGAAIGRCVIDTEGDVWGFDCFARATGNPRVRRLEKEPAPSMMVSNVRRWKAGELSWRFNVPQLREVPEYNMGDWETVRVHYPTRADIPAGLIEALDEYSLRKYRQDCAIADKNNYPV